MPIDCTFQVASWAEETARELPDGRKLSNATVSYTYEGGLAGTGHVDYLMSYAGPMTARFVGREWFEGTVEGKSGGFAIEHVGTFENGVASARWSIVAGSGTGELASISGEGEYAATSPTVAFRPEISFGD